MKCAKRKKVALAKRRQQFAAGRVYYADDETLPPAPADRPNDFPDHLFARVAAAVPRSCDIEGHEERMAAHCERVAREDRPCCGRAFTICFACGAVGHRKMAVHRNRKMRWHARQFGCGDAMEIYCRECFDVWGWPDEYAERVSLFARGLIRPDPEPEAA